MRKQRDEVGKLRVLSFCVLIRTFSYEVLASLTRWNLSITTGRPGNTLSCDVSDSPLNAAYVIGQSSEAIAHALLLDECNAAGSHSPIRVDSDQFLNERLATLAAAVTLDGGLDENVLAEHWRITEAKLLGAMPVQSTDHAALLAGFCWHGVLSLNDAFVGMVIGAGNRPAGELEYVGHGSCGPLSLCKLAIVFDPWRVFFERNGSIKTRDNPSLKVFEILSPGVVDHWVWLNTDRNHLIESLPYAIPRLQWVISDKHISHQMLGRDSGVVQCINTIEKHFLVLEIVPSGIELSLIELGVSVLNRGKCFRSLLVNQPDVDPLAQADLKCTIPYLRNTCLPIIPCLAEEVVIKQVQLLGMAITAPNVIDRINGAVLTLLVGDNAELAFQSAPALRESNGSIEVRPSRIVIGGVILTDDILNGDGASASSSSDDRVRPLQFEAVIPFIGERKYGASVNAVIPWLKQVWIDLSRHVDVIAFRFMPVSQLHKSEVWKSAINLCYANIHNAVSTRYYE